MDKSRIEEARRRIPLSELVAPTVRLRRVSGGFIGLCPFHREHTPSFHVSNLRQTYKCFGCGRQGDVFDYLMETRNVTFDKAVTMLAGDDPVTPVTRTPIEGIVEEREDEKRRIRFAHEIWLKRTPLGGTLGERYLNTTRKLRRPFSDILGFVDAAYCSVLGEESPALIAPLQDSNGHVTAIQQIFLSYETDDAWRDENNRRIKRTVGLMRDGAVRLAMPQHTLGLAGSVEDALSAMQLFSLPVWAVCGEHRLSRVWVPDDINHLVIFGDADEAGRREAEKCRHAPQFRHSLVEIMTPDDKKDWSQLLMERAA